MTTETFLGEFLTPDDLVRRWKNTVALGTLATWRSRKNGPPFVKIGGRVLYRKAEVEAWERKNSRANV